MEDEAHQQPHTNGRRRELTLKLPGGMSMTFRGYDIIMLIITGASCLLVYMFYEFKEVNAKEHVAIKEQQKIHTQTLQEISYIMTLTQEQREKLGLDMPSSLRERRRHNRRRDESE